MPLEVPETGGFSAGVIRAVLKPHPAVPSTAVAGIDVLVARSPAGQLTLHYVVTGEIAEVVLPPAGEPVRADGLWQHTCFEAFLREASGTAYCEFNFTPSLYWAAYHFDGYRSGMRIADGLADPRIETETSDTQFELRTRLELSVVPVLRCDGPWQLGLSAVIEETSGRKSYWALAHPPAKPDFHHPDGFVLELS